MKHIRLQSAQGGHDGRSSLIDFISKMPDDVLVMILSRLPIKGAVVTSSLSTRWRFLWRNLIQLNFDETDTLNKMAKDERLCELEGDKFITQVSEVLSSYNHPRVQDFRIRHYLDDSYSVDIDEWIRFALDKKVEKLELDLLDKSYSVRDPDENYDFVLPSSNAMVGKMLSLKKLFLKGVNLDGPTLNNILKNSPHLTVLYLYGSYLFPYINVGGHDINLKHFKLVE